MCASYSGRCVLSNFLTARDSNRGGCSQICRWDFTLENEKEEKIEGEKDFTFCTKDLSMLKEIPTMIDMGITSFKIEGRMRSIYYLATVVGVYRKVIDRYLENKDSYSYHQEDERILRNVANRDSVVQFFDDNFDQTCQYYNGRIEVSNQDFLGIVLDYDPNTKVALIEQRNYFKPGDVVEFFGPTMDAITYVIPKIYDENQEELEVARHPRQKIKMTVDIFLHQYDLMRIKRND